jgi:hypothetical protein
LLSTHTDDFKRINGTTVYRKHRRIAVRPFTDIAKARDNRTVPTAAPDLMRIHLSYAMDAEVRALGTNAVVLHALQA